jgi:SepF-like predicted cell division protein (DUF552 family)
MKKQKDGSLVLFENDSVRRVWVEQEEKWYFSVVDVVRVLTGSSDSGAYWRKLKQRLIEEGNQSVTKCHGLNEEKGQLSTVCRQLKFLAKDGGGVAGRTRKDIEKISGEKIVTPNNFKLLKTKKIN